MYFNPLFLVSALLAVPTKAAVGPTGDLVISSVEVSPDGFKRTATLAGGTVVGELVRGNKGDNFRINVINNLNDDTMLKSTTIHGQHWHGIFQGGGSNWADGTAFVTQCPIAANNSFLYDFTVPDQAGTFWYHSHLSTQYCDGLRGPMIIYDPKDPYAHLYDVDDESTIITLSDWFHEKAETLVYPLPNATLINGLGRYSTGGATKLAVVSVVQGVRYRMRLLNIACDPNFVFAIDNHTMTVIEVDGVNHEQYVVDSIQIFSGQRYSFVLEANQSIDNYWIRADPSSGASGFSGGINSAILRYVGAKELEPCTSQAASVLPLNETDLVPLENPGAPGTPEVGGVDYALNLVFGLNTATLNYTVNGVIYEPPPVPVLLQVLSGAQPANDLLPSGTVFPLPGNSTIELSIPALSDIGSPHPMHLHGHNFDVVRSAGSKTYNYANPVRRDVVNIGTGDDNVTIRFTTDNAGPWFLHCHIDWHLKAGFATVFAEDTGDWNSTIAPSTAWKDLCPIYDSLSSSQL